MTYLSERFEKLTNDQLLVIFINEPNAILKRWERVGLLEGILHEERSALAFYYEATFQYLTHNYPNSDYEGSKELIFIPMIRKLFVRNKLDVFFLFEKFESQIYNNQLMNYTNQSEVDDAFLKVSGAKGFIEFLPKLDTHFTIWEKDVWPEIAKTYSNPDEVDMDCELLVTYIDRFELTQID